MTLFCNSVFGCPGLLLVFVPPVVPPPPIKVLNILSFNENKFYFISSFWGENDS